MDDHPHPTPDPRTAPAPPGRWALAAWALALTGTLLLGLAMRWMLAGRFALHWNFFHVRHAHSHLGYYGVLFPLAWLGWKAAGAPVPSRRVLYSYALATVLATAGFLRAGYGIEGIVGSTWVGGVWLWSAWRARGRMRDRIDPLGAVFGGIMAAQLCIPPLAIFLRRDPTLAQGFVSTFLALLLLAVIVPSALSAAAVALPWRAWLGSALLGAIAVGVGRPWWGLRLALAAAGVVLFAAVRQAARQANQRAARKANQPAPPPHHLQWAWFGAAAGLVAMGTGALPIDRFVIIGATHYLVLGPVLVSLVLPYSTVLQRRPALAWALHATAAGHAAPLVALAFGAGTWALDASAWFATASALTWLGVAASSGLHRRGSARRFTGS